MKYLLLLMFLLLLVGCATQEVDPCTQRITGDGECKEKFVGFQYSSSQNACGVVKIAGCEIDRPFDTYEDCFYACVQ